MTQPRDPRPTCPPEPLEITEEEYGASEENYWLAKAQYDTRQRTCNSPAPHDYWVHVQNIEAQFKRAEASWEDAQRRATSDHQTLWRDDPAYRREVMEREWD